MEVIEPADENAEAAPAEQDKPAEDEPSRKLDNPVIAFLDVVCRLLEGLFQHTPHCRDFLTNYGVLEQIGRITGLPALPHDFGNSMASDSLVQAVRTMFDASANVTMGALCELVKASLKETKDFWAELKPGSRLLELLDNKMYDERRAGETFRRLITLHVRVMLLSDVYSTVGYSHGRSALGLLQILMGRGAPEVLPELGALHRALVWEIVQMKAAPTVESAQAATATATSSTSALELMPAATPAPAPVTNGHVSDDALLSETSGASTSPTPAPVAAEAEATSAPTPAETKKDKDEPALHALKQVATHIPNALTPFFHAIVKLFSTRRHPDAAQKQIIRDASGRLSAILLQHLQPVKIEGSQLDVTAYYTSLVGLVATFLIEERSGVMTLFTRLLNTFYRDGGFDALLNICRHFITVVEEFSSIAQDTRTAEQSTELASAYGGLKIALHLLHPVVSLKPVFESPQTNLLITRDKKDGEPGYFEPHNFLVRMRLAVLPLAREPWSAPWLADAPAGLVRSVAQTVLEIANAEGEENHAAEAAAQAPAAMFRQPAVPDEARITQIQDTGFPRWAAERALARTANNVNAATELLLANPFRFQPDVPPAAAADAAAAAPAAAEPAAAPATPPAAEPAADVPEGGEDEDHEMVDEDGEGSNGSDGNDDGENEGEGDGDGDGDDAESGDGESEPADSVQDDDEPMSPAAPEPDPEAPKEPVKTSTQWREELNEAREPLKADLGATALKLVDAHPTLIFDMQTAFVGKPESLKKENIRLPVRDVRAFAVHAIDTQEQPLAVRYRLLALVLNEAPASFAAVAKGDEITAFVDQLVALVLSAPISQPDSKPPKWLAAILLAAESILTIGLTCRPVYREPFILLFVQVPLCPARQLSSRDGRRLRSRRTALPSSNSGSC